MELTPEEFAKKECERKDAFPLITMAIRAANIATAQEGEEVHAYECKVCGKFHIGHKKSSSEKRREEMEAAIEKRKFSVVYEGITYAKIRDHLHNHYVFMIPSNCPETETHVLDIGVLIATKKNGGFYLEKDNKKSDNWRLFNEIFPIHSKEIVRFKEKIEKHEENMMGFQEAKMLILNKELKIGTAQEGGSLRLIRHDKKTLEPEKFKGREVFRTPEGRPFFADTLKCADCGEEIMTRQYISQDGQGEFTWVNQRISLDGKARVKEGSKGTHPEWQCRKCVGQVSPAAAEKPEEAKKPAMAVTPENSLRLLADLEMIAADASHDANFVRGATLMACYLLKGMGNEVAQ